MKSRDRICAGSIERIKEAIGDAGGNEIFVVGTIDEEGLLGEIKIVARGTESAVPVLDPHIDQGDVVLHNHPSGVLYPSSADMLIAYRLGNAGIGFFIVDNEVEEVYVVAEPVTGKGSQVPLDEEALAAKLMPGGEMSRFFDHYEVRDSQIQMLKMVTRSVNENKICIAEAGTGVGKSLAYLLPVFQWIAQNNERFVISTGTINLQEQLIEKDIPMVQKLLSSDVKAVLVKGRGNYVCLNRAREAVTDLGLFEEENHEVEKLFEWAHSSATGDRSDLPFFPSDEAWSRVRSETDTCVGLRCPFRENCFVLKSRREAAGANILVVNHHLLFSDLSVRMAGMGFENTAVLPPFQRIVFDEAHNIENSVTSFFSEGFSRYSLSRYLNRLVFIKRGRSQGLILKLQLRFPEDKLLNQSVKIIQEINESMNSFEQSCLEILANQGNFHFKNFTGTEMNNRFFFDPLFDLQKKILRLVSIMEDFFDLLDDQDKDEATAYEAGLQIKRLKGIAEVCGRFRGLCQPAEDQDDRDIYWMEKIRWGKGVSIRLTITPLHIAPVMEKALYEPFESLIFTSATLSVDRDFSFWKSRMGMDMEVLEDSFPSPFNYKENVLLGIPLDAPLPEQGDAFQKFVSSFIKQVLIISEGRALVLFTSYYMLNRTYDEIRDSLEEFGVTIFKQGEDDRGRLLSRFKSQIGSVLFATDSFWEGVDTPGKTLEVLILCKLPFRVPTDPIIKARVDDINSRGGNAFTDYSLPEAVIKFKQGFGRLMRRGDDSGVVLILDTRVVKKSYGSAFLHSLPETTLELKEPPVLLEKIENFIAHIRRDE